MKTKIIFLFFLILIVFLGFFYQAVYFPLQNEGTAKETIFEVERNQGLFEISKNLEKEGLIKNNLAFEIYVILKKDFKALKRGSYKLNSSMSIVEIARKIVKGETIQSNLTFIEGWNKKQIANYLDKKNIIKKGDFIKATENYSSNLIILESKPKNNDLEGYLFPDTYSFNNNVSSQEIIKKMVLNLQEKLSEEIGEDLKIEDKSIHEIITMASLIEKEVQSYEDKRLVSGIAWKRIENQIPLQIDATIAYLTGKKSTKISIEETKIDSPYNTYKYKGLPPGPICNPGLESIKAALEPKKSEYWYYLSAPNGETIFSKNLFQHQVAKNKYLR